MAMRDVAPVGALFGGAAPTEDVLILFRTMQGFSAGVAQPLVMAIIFSVFPPERRGMASSLQACLGSTANGLVAGVLAPLVMHSAIALAPLMLVVPLTQLALVFRFGFSAWLNPEHEVFGAAVVAGTVISLFGALLVSVDTNFLLGALGAPEPLAAWLGQRWP